jgi:hypothetical protein
MLEFEFVRARNKETDNLKGKHLQEKKRSKDLCVCIVNVVILYNLNST